VAPVTGGPMFQPDLAAWDPWQPPVVAERLAGVAPPWYVAAGWALDLFLGGQTRTHGDLEIGVPADRFDEVARRFGDCEFFAIGDGQAVPYASAPSHFHQTWARERATGAWRFDVFREPGDGDTWICRRDAAIRLPYEQLIARTSDGIPYCQPEVALLFKAKNPRDKDEADFARVLPVLDPARRQWLAAALRKVHPGHRWLDAL
jgi:Aminoglycoside-2''-adenylyltransferase